MVAQILVLSLLAGAPVLGATVLTAMGEHRRSRRWTLALLAGLLFPIAWMIWYVRDGESARHAS